MSADKYLSIFSRQMEAIVYIYTASQHLYVMKTRVTVFLVHTLCIVKKENTEKSMLYPLPGNEKYAND